MTLINPQMKRLYSKLQTVGYNQKYIKWLLPERQNTTDTQKIDDATNPNLPHQPCIITGK